MESQKSSTTILLTGASGFVGRHLAQTIIKRHIPLRCATRQTLPLVDVDCITVGDIHENTDWHPALQGITTVIHCAARVHVMNDTASDPLRAFRQVNVQGTLALAEQAARAGVRQFIFLSSIKVNGEATTLGVPFTETNMPQASDPYGISKLEAEQDLLVLGQKTGMAITIVRPPLVYGDGVGANFLQMLRWVQKKIPLPLKHIHNRRSFIYVENLVDFILHCIDHPRAYNEIFLVSDDHDLSTPALLQEAARALQVPSRLFYFPVSALRLCAALIGRKSSVDRLCQSLQVDISKAKSLVAWAPPFTVAQGIAASTNALHFTQ